MLRFTVAEDQIRQYLRVVTSCFRFADGSTEIVKFSRVLPNGGPAGELLRVTSTDQADEPTAVRRRKHLRVEGKVEAVNRESLMLAESMERERNS